MNDRELVDWLRDEAEKQDDDGWCVFASKLNLAAARLDRLRWRSVGEGLPVHNETCATGLSLHTDKKGNATHWRYVTPPGEGE